MSLKFKVSVPATSANIGVGYDCLGVALDYKLELEVEESDKIEFLENGVPFSIPIEENYIFESIKYTEKYLPENNNDNIHEIPNFAKGFLDREKPQNKNK